MRFALVYLPELLCTLYLDPYTVLQHVLQLLPLGRALDKRLWVRPCYLDGSRGLGDVSELPFMQWVLVKRLLVVVLCLLYRKLLLVRRVQMVLSA